MSKTNGKSETRNAPHQLAAPSRTVIDGVLSKASPPTRTLIEFAVCTATRSSDLLALRWSDIDIARVTVRQRREKEV